MAPGVPTAVRFPSTLSLKPSANFTQTPGSMVRVAPGVTVTSLITTNGLSTNAHVVSVVMSLSMNVSARAGTGR